MEIPVQENFRVHQHSQQLKTMNKVRSILRQFLVLLYKGALLRKRHYIVTFFEIVIPIFIASIFPMILSEQRASMKEDFRDYREGSGSGQWEKSTTFKPYSPYSYYGYGDTYIVYTPADSVTKEFVEKAVEMLKENKPRSDYREDVKFIIHGVNTENALQKYCLDLLLSPDRINILGTVFNNFDSKQNKLPSSLDYKIRYADGNTYNQFQTSKKYRALEYDSPHYDPAYKNTFFLSWQTSVEETFIEAKMNETGKALDYKVNMQRFPFPEHRKASGGLDPISLTPLLLNYGYFIFMLNLLRRVIEEKSNGSKELMKMMGMTDTVYWFSTFLNYFIVGFLTVLSITIIYKAPLRTGYVYLEGVNFFLILLLLLLYITSVILFCMAFTIFFKRAVFAIIAFIVLWDSSFNVLMQRYFLMNIQTNYFDLPLSGKLGLCLLPTGSLLTVFSIIPVQKQWGNGITWSNLSDHALSPDITLAMVLGMMILSCFIYIFIIWYFDKVWPWQPGVPQPFYFMFTRSYWCGSKPNFDDYEEMKDRNKEEEFFEDEPSGVPRGVEIRNLSKGFQVNFQTKMAVKNLSLNIYRGQITALLGHNGAGKTTTINILTGLYTPSSGTASINGMDILTDTHAARQGLGVCPQHNVLFDTLTVEEHLKIFAGLKGIPWSLLEAESLKVLNILKFTDKRHELVKNLSGGMKRKLSLGNAIVGGSNVLFLDEPTSGMDVEARRSVWDSLLGIRQERTIILTTHYMEEADILGDRIAIMAEGEMQCCGSPIFLKKKFGTGYHLHMVKNPDFRLDAINDMLTRHLPEIKVTKELENEITYNLPSNSGRTLGEMFEELENRKDKLGVNSCGITVTTMEDVFLKVSNMSDIKYTKKSERTLQNGVSFEYEDVYDSARQLSMNRSLAHQFFALLEKRFHYTKRHWSILINQLIVPFLFICFCFTTIKSIKAQFQDSFDPIQLDITSVYGSTDGFYYSTTDKNITNKIDSVLKGNNVNDPQVDNPTHYLLNYGNKDLTNYLKKLMVGASVDRFTNGTLNLTAWYNGEPYHALPMSLLLTHTAILKHVSSNDATISLTNAPLARYRNDLSGFEGTFEGSMASVFITIALGFMAACAVLVPIHERATKAQLLQLMTGIPNAMYWLSMFLWDFILFFIVSIILIIPFAIFYNYVFFAQHSEAIFYVLLIFWAYGFASTPLSYLVSLIFKKGNTGFSIVTGMSVIFGVALSSILSTAYSITAYSTSAQNIVAAFIWVARLFPFYSLASGISKLFQIAFANSYCEGIPQEDLINTCESENILSTNPLFKCCKKICGQYCLNQTSYMNWEMNGIGRDFSFLIIDGLLYFLILLLIQDNLFQKLFRLIMMRLGRKRATGQIFQSDIIEDSGVIEEENRVHNMVSTQGGIGNEALVTMDLTKVFRNFYAVERLSVGIHQEECFGLLGVNGAGKTTTFRMLTGDCNPTSGNALTTHTTLLANTKKFQSFLGYCPQFDALIDRLTGRETLILYGRLRGLSGVALRDTVSKLIRMTDLTDHADKQTSFYSGGNKRKLSVAIALIGSPPLILLDEPTAGVDPVSRRKIWNILAQARNFTKAAVVLTTHSMEESEALCSRLAIMVNGRFRCLGSIQQLKAKFGQGYTLILKMRKETSENPQSVAAIKTFIGNQLRGADLKDDHQGMLQYHITDPSVRLSRLFKLMEEMKTHFNLEDYIISDTSLEQIFLAFARAQRIVA